MISELRRTVLYVPGDSEKMLSKAVSAAADLLLLNLEDGVAGAKKDEARENVARALRSLEFGSKEVVVRINSMESEVGRKDLAAMVPCRPDGICLPKVESAAEISAADIAVLELEQGYGVAEGELRFHAMIESARGLLQAPAIAAASPRLASLIFGSADFIQDVRCDPGVDRVELLLALEHIVLAARAAGLDAIDAPCFELRDQDRLRREATQARRIGFDGKSALHPAQLEIINQVFEVTSDEIAWAEKVVAELNRAEARGRALSTLDGMLIDNPHRAAADRILRRAALAKGRPQVTG